MVPVAKAPVMAGVGHVQVRAAQSWIPPPGIFDHFWPFPCETIKKTRVAVHHRRPASRHEVEIGYCVD